MGGIDSIKFFFQVMAAGLTIETQTEPLEVEFVKPAPPPPAKHEAHIKQVQLQGQ